MELAAAAVRVKPQTALHVVKVAGALVVVLEFMVRALAVLAVLVEREPLLVVVAAVVVGLLVEQQQTGVTPVLAVILVVVVVRALGPTAITAAGLTVLIMFSALAAAVQSVLSGLAALAEPHRSHQLV